MSEFNSLLFLHNSRYFPSMLSISMIYLMKNGKKVEARVIHDMLLPTVNRLPLFVFSLRPYSYSYC
jgi:hypothetical protein